MNLYGPPITTIRIKIVNAENYIIEIGIKH